MEHYFFDNKNGTLKSEAVEVTKGGEREGKAVWWIKWNWWKWICRSSLKFGVFRSQLYRFIDYNRLNCYLLLFLWWWWNSYQARENLKQRYLPSRFGWCFGLCFFFAATFIVYLIYKNWLAFGWMNLFFSSICFLYLI